MTDPLPSAGGHKSTTLQDFEADPRMWHYLPLHEALEQRVVPMTIIGNRLQVASATPDPDLAVLHRHFPALQIDVVIAPANEIDRVLAHAQGPDA
ncbi:hypothetical protein DSM112329_05128 [Paraconexibacter sp. AEG42_29]|uniref:Type II secretion system protein GspE N-terminal domain-containing protein n=1 Tax=Paraconexibacter sp. AEG42_29 TaxID=2997339 RepID=A0AAU7B2K2_9ACTN